MLVQTKVEFFGIFDGWWLRSEVGVLGSSDCRYELFWPHCGWRMAIALIRALVACRKVDAGLVVDVALCLFGVT